MSEMSHKAGRAAFGKAIDMAMKNADKNWEKEVNRILSLSESYMKGEKLDIDYEKARQMVCDRDGTLNKYINRILTEVDPHVLRTTALNLGFEAFFHGTKTIRKMRTVHQCNVP
ncbi:MAG: pyrroloquinoline quinone biosynthesis protein PqqE, partial [Lachnospiraceae bacterium]|nr:pyrroloquinoline quinone biosynthesis protein PqqE [Lachnospiraceae bacterium]